MMLNRLIYISFTAFICLTLACAVRPDIEAGSNGSGKSFDENSGEKLDIFIEPKKILLKAIDTKVVEPENYDLSQSSEIAWSSASEAVLTHADGRSIAFNFKNSTWSSVHSNPSMTDYQILYDFRDAGFFGESANVLSFKGGSGQVIQLQASDELKAQQLLGANPGFVAYRDQERISALFAGTGGVTLYPLSGAPKNLRLIYPCNLHCLAWGFDGQDIYLYFERTGWKALDQPLNLPTDDAIARIALRFRANNNPIAIESIVVQTAEGTLFAQVMDNVAAPEPNWEDVRTLATRFCVQCHLDDGFDKESTWKMLKGEIVKRLSLMSGSKGAMPPIETTLGKEMSQSERDSILAWIKKQDQVDGGGPVGSTSDPVADNSATSGELKKFADKYCVACHTNAQKNSFWRNGQANIISRIQSGNMPKDQTIPEVEKKQFLDAIAALPRPSA